MQAHNIYIPNWVQHWLYTNKHLKPVLPEDKGIYKQAEAFCHMFYFCEDRRASEHERVIRIWNSRDKVTPFIVIHNHMEYQHSYFQLDRRDLDYKPNKGDFIFRDRTEEEAKISTENRINQIKKMNELKNLFPDEEYYKGLFESLYQERLNYSYFVEVN